MKRIVLYQEELYIIIQHISDTGIKYPPMTIRKLSTMTQYEADLIRYLIKKNACESDSKPLYSLIVNNGLINDVKKRSLNH